MHRRVKINQIGDSCACGPLSLVRSLKTANTRDLCPGEVVWVPERGLGPVTDQIADKVEKNMALSYLVYTNEPATRPVYFANSTERSMTIPHKLNSKASQDMAGQIAETVSTYDMAMQTELSNIRAAGDYRSSLAPLNKHNEDLDSAEERRRKEQALDAAMQKTIARQVQQAVEIALANTNTLSEFPAEDVIQRRIDDAVAAALAARDVAQEPEPELDTEGQEPQDEGEDVGQVAPVQVKPRPPARRIKRVD